MEPAAESSQHLIADGARIARGRIHRAVRTQEFQPMSWPDLGLIGDVERCQVHGHTAYQWNRVAVKIRLTRVGVTAVPAIGIADANRRDTAGPRRSPGGVVTNR